MSEVYILSSGGIEGGRVRGVFFERTMALVVARQLAHREWHESRRHGRPCFRRRDIMRFMLRPAVDEKGQVYGFAETLRTGRENDDQWYEWWLTVLVLAIAGFVHCCGVLVLR